MTGGPPDSRGARILEAVVIAVLTAAGAKLLEAVAERLKKPRRRKRKPRAAAPPPEDCEPDPLDAGAPWHVYPAGEGHDTENGAACWCKPDVDESGIIVHRQQVA